MIRFADRQPTAPDGESEAAPNPEMDGEEKAVLFRSIYQSQINYVWNLLLRLGVRDADLEDVAHDMFVTVNRLLPAFDRSRPVRPWLMAIAYRTASNWRRSAPVRREVPLLDEHTEISDDAPLPDERVFEDQARRMVLRALDDLDDERRAVLVMHDIEGTPVPEIAEATGVPLNTLYSRLRSARTQLKAAVDRLRDGRDP